MRREVEEIRREKEREPWKSQDKRRNPNKCEIFECAILNWRRKKELHWINRPPNSFKPK